MNRFPERRRDTITLRNVRRLWASGEFKTADEMADHFCGTGLSGLRHAKPRHIKRCRRLLDKVRRCA